MNSSIAYASAVSNPPSHLETALDPAHPYFDPSATPDNPKWSVVHVEFRRKFKEIISLTELKKFAQSGGVLEQMEVVKQSRLSVSKVRKREWDFIIGLADDAEDSEEEAQGGLVPAAKVDGGKDENGGDDSPAGPVPVEKGDGGEGE